jgi:hypothetical protein
MYTASRKAATRGLCVASERVIVAAISQRTSRPIKSTRRRRTVTATATTATAIAGMVSAQNTPTPKARNR